jgi:hypothetical protein
VSISKDISADAVVAAVEGKFSNTIVNEAIIDSDDIVVSISGEGMSYKRSLERDLDMILD